MSSRSTVRPQIAQITEEIAREVLAKTLLSACSKSGPKAVGLAIGTNEKTVRNARDEKSTLRLDHAVNLLTVNDLAFEPFLNRVGRRSVPIGSVCDTDDRCSQSKVLAAALALSIALEDDGEISPLEVMQNRGTIEAARDALDGLLNKLVRAA